VGVLLVGAATSRAQGVLALLLFAGATAASMALVSAGFGYALARAPIASRLARLVPVLGVASLLFGLWYTLGAIRG
jgi:hypothetical protein